MPACRVKTDVYEYGRFSPGEVVSFFVVPAKGMGRKTSETTSFPRETPRVAIRGAERWVERRKGDAIWPKLGEDGICHQHLPRLISPRVRCARPCHRMQRQHENALHDETEPFFRFSPLPRRKFATRLDTKNVPCAALCARKRPCNPRHVPFARSTPHGCDRMIGADCGMRLGPRYLLPPR